MICLRMQVENAFSGAGNLFVLKLVSYAVLMWQKQADFTDGIARKAPNVGETHSLGDAIRMLNRRYCKVS